MTVPPALPPLLRRALRVLAVLFALGVSGFALAAAAMFFWVLPKLDTHRDHLAQALSRALGHRVTIEAASGQWQQARPEFRLQGVRLYDAAGRAALYLPAFEASFSWRSFLLLEPRFNHIELQGLALGVRRARDGHVYIGGIPVNPADPDSGASSWLLRQGEVHVGAASLTWVDEVRGAPPLVLQDVDFTLSNRRHSHRMQLRARPPAAVARPLTAQATLRARDLDAPATWDAQIDASVAGVAFARLAPWLEVPYQPRQGWGALGVRFGIAAGRLAAVRADLDLYGISTALGAALPPLQLERVRGQAVWQRTRDAQRVAFENLRVALPGAALGAPFNVGVSWNGTARELSARALRLDGWQTLLPSLPIDDALRARMQRLQPAGRLDTFAFRWAGAEPGLDNFSLDARFRGLGLAVSDTQPGFANLSGHVEGDARQGRFDIDTRDLVLDLPALFRESRMTLDTLQARGGWKRTSRGRLVTLDHANFANADAAGSASGQYEQVPGTAGLIDLEARLTRADGTAVYRYLPLRVSDPTVEWVRQSIVAGGSNDVRLRLKGDLARFPFDAGDGMFQVDAQVRDGVVDYATGWPRIEGVQGRLLFEGKRMEVVPTHARIYGATLHPVRVTIPDLTHHDEILLIDGEANGPLQDFIRFANFSPVGERLRGMTEGLDGSGPMRLALKMQVPLRRSHETTLTGQLSFLGNTLFPPGWPRIEGARGTLAFTGDSVSGQKLGASFLGGPLSVNVVTQAGQVQIQAQGRATAAGLAPWLGDTWGSRVSGQTGWLGQIDLEEKGERVRIESDLVGLASTLPSPLAKAATQPLPLSLVSRPDGEGLQRELRLGRLVGAVWRSVAGGALERGEIRFGGTPSLPDAPGLRLAGSGRAIDLSGWAALLPSGGASAAPIAALDLGFDTLDLLGRRYRDVRVLGRARNGLLRVQVSGQDVSGTLTWRPAGEQPARLSAQFRQLAVPERVDVAGPPGNRFTVPASGFPLLDVSIEDFRMEGRPFGRLEAVARGTAGGLAIERLALVHPDSVFQMSGLWRDSGQGETRAELALDVKDAGKLLARLGYPDTLRHGSGKIQGHATWEGSPADFALATLAGQLQFEARSGQFLQVDPGAGKLLGVLSLQALPRRLSFDFRDIFSKGFAFDDIGATLRIARGVLYSDDLKMRGPSAKVNMSGLADLNQETVQLRVKVIPKLSEGVAVAGALLGGPVAGVGVLAAQKLLRDPIEEASSQEYLVSGAWQAPDVKKLPKTKTDQTSDKASEP